MGKFLLCAALVSGSFAAWGQEAELTDEQKQGYIDQVKAIALANVDPDRTVEIMTAIDRAALDSEWTSSAIIVCWGSEIRVFASAGLITEFKISPSLLNLGSNINTLSKSKPSNADLKRWVRASSALLASGKNSTRFQRFLAKEKSGFSDFQKKNPSYLQCNVMAERFFGDFPVQSAISTYAFDLETRAVVGWKGAMVLSPEGGHKISVDEKDQVDPENLDRAADLNSAILAAFRQHQGYVVRWWDQDYTYIQHRDADGRRSLIEQPRSDDPFGRIGRFFLASYVRLIFDDRITRRFHVTVHAASHDKLRIVRTDRAAYDPSLDPLISSYISLPPPRIEHLTWRDIHDRKHVLYQLEKIEEPLLPSIERSTILVSPAGMAIRVFMNKNCDYVRVNHREAISWYRPDEKFRQVLLRSHLDLRPFGKVVQPAQKPEGPGTLLNFMP